MNSCADRVFAGRRAGEAELGQLLGEKLVRDLHQNAGAVAGARIGADRAAMFEIEQDRQRVFDDLVRFAALDVGNESDAAGILSPAPDQTGRNPTRPSSSSHSRAGTPTAHCPGFGIMHPAQDRVFRRQGRAMILKATFVPPPGPGCFSAAVRRALVTAARRGVCPAPLPGRAPSATNWDSNAVLCQHRNRRRRRAPAHERPW